MNDKAPFNETQLTPGLILSKNNGKFRGLNSTYHNLFRTGNEFLFVVQILELRHEPEHLLHSLHRSLRRLAGKQEVCKNSGIV